MKRNKSRTDSLRKESGKIKSKDELVVFLYILMRDYLPCGYVEEIIQNNVLKEKNKECTFTNGYLASYAIISAIFLA